MGSLDLWTSTVRASPLLSLPFVRRVTRPHFLTTTGLGWQQRTSTGGLTNTSLALRLPEVERPSKVTPVWLVPAPMPAARSNWPSAPPVLIVVTGRGVGQGQGFGEGV